MEHPKQTIYTKSLFESHEKKTSKKKTVGNGIIGLTDYDPKKKKKYKRIVFSCAWDRRTEDEILKVLP